jgi:hypothetical protein
VNRGSIPLRRTNFKKDTHMTDEDLVAAKLKGYNCLIKFKDGEELFIKSADVTDGTTDSELEWFQDVEKYINEQDKEDLPYFPLQGIAVARNSIKYVKKI